MLLKSKPVNVFAVLRFFISSYRMAEIIAISRDLMGLYMPEADWHIFKDTSVQ